MNPSRRIRTAPGRTGTRRRNAVFVARNSTFSLPAKHTCDFFLSDFRDSTAVDFFIFSCTRFIFSPRPGNANEDDARNAGGTLRPISRALDIAAARIVYTRNCITSTGGTNAHRPLCPGTAFEWFSLFFVSSYFVVIIVVASAIDVSNARARNNGYAHAGRVGFRFFPEPHVCRPAIAGRTNRLCR